MLLICASTSLHLPRGHRGEGLVEEKCDFHIALSVCCSFITLNVTLNFVSTTCISKFQKKSHISATTLSTVQFLAHLATSIYNRMSHKEKNEGGSHVYLYVHALLYIGSVTHWQLVWGIPQHWPDDSLDTFNQSRFGKCMNKDNHAVKCCSENLKEL